MNSIMENLLAESKIMHLSKGSIVKGTIVEICHNEVIIDIGGKSPGSINPNEFFDTRDLKIGSKIEVYLEKLENRDGSPVVSFDKAQQRKNWENILSKCEEGSIISGRIKSKVKGGLIVSIGVDAFLPASQIDIQPPKNLDQYLGQTHDFKIIKINTERKNIVISRRELIEEQRQEKRRQLLDKVKKGDICRGTVKNITDYGAFVDLSGLDGLLHITDMSWGRITHPSEVVKIAEEIKVQIIDVDRDRERVSLGIKQLKPNPWKSIEEKYPTGSTVSGKVVNVVTYGAFIELEDGVEGLIHSTEISWTKRITKPSEFLKVGQVLNAKVLGLQKEEQKISLGIRQLENNPWDAVIRNYPVGARVKGSVRNLTAYGAFIELEEGIDGMVHVSDMSWMRKINHPSELLQKGDIVHATVLDVDSSQQRISLGIKQLHEDPWETINNTFRVGDIIQGKVSKLTTYGAFISLQNDIDGLVHISQVGENRIDHIKDILELEQIVNARVIKIDHEERRIGLSIKAANYDNDRLLEEVEAFDKISQDQDLTSLGEILDEISNTI